MSFARAFFSGFVFAALATAAAAAEPARTLPLASAFPTANATNVCPDTPLRLTFPAPPTLGSRGKIRIVDAADHRVVDEIDVSSPVATKAIGGLPNYHYYPVLIFDREAMIFPRNGALAYGRRYFVTIDAGVFLYAAQPSAALVAEDAWRFATRPAPPAADATRLVVAADGTGDFCTVQGALDFVPDGNTTPRTIFVRRGLYPEIVFFTNKHALTLLGEDRRQTVIAYATNDRFNPSSGNPFGSANPNPSAASPRTSGGNIYHRGVFLAHRVDDLTLANLTIRNTTPQGGSQAEAIILNGTPTSHAILKDVDLYSYQDTLQINGQAYLENCFLEGDVDFMWGTGPCFFQNCTARALRSGAYYTQIRNPATNHGFVYARCTFDGAPGVMGNFLSRIGTGRFPDSEVVLLDCTLTSAVGPVGWLFSGGREGNEHDPARVHFWEFNSRRPDGSPVDISQRLAGSKQLDATADVATLARYRDPRFVLGGDWDPRAAPIFASPAASQNKAPPHAADAPSISLQPAPSQLALLGTSAVLEVVAADSRADQRLGYQWRKDGRAIPGATSPTLRLPAMTWQDAGIYTVAVSNSAGTTVSEPAELIALAPAASPAPALPSIPPTIFNAAAFGAKGDGATDNTAAIQKTVDAALAAGGGIVVLPAAAKSYLCGPITLGSRIDFEIAHGATLQLLPYSAESKPGAYPRGDRRYPHFITATHAHDLALTGGGTIDGDGEAWWAAFRADRAMPSRPYLVRLEACERVLVSGLTFRRSPMFHVVPNSTNQLTIVGVTIDAPGKDAPNTDGIDPSGEHQLIQNCVVSVGDDNVVLKPGGTFCGDVTVADCFFGDGHGVSVGGQTNRGLDGLTVKNCFFAGTETALRLKADATQGGPVRHLAYSNLVMENVTYPFVFYSYYNKIGNPGGVSGNNLTTPEKVRAWNAAPPNPLPSPTLPAWQDIALTNIVATGTKAFAVIWGLPLEGHFVENVTLHDVRILGGRGCEIFDATNIQLTGDTDLGPIVAANSLALTRPPQDQAVAPGASATFSAATAGTSGVRETPPTFRWTRDGTPLADGAQPDGTIVSGATTATLNLANIQPAAAGKYAATATDALDVYDPATKAIAPDRLAVEAHSRAATLTVEPAAKP
ncbi:MAG TPA: pectinesterase family protein [Opitutaceae bacterium]|nr:pectinesterase family protein [Opitutaceae bacterium]